jgi:arginyl-tRNA synthetase
MQRFAEQIRAALHAHTGVELEQLRVEQPRDPELGDFAFPCFVLAKALKAAPPKIAAELAPKLAAELEGITAEAAGPYVNFRVERALLAETVLGGVDEQGARYGGSDEGAGRTIVIDLSSPNIAKRMHVGNLRSTIIGAAIQRLHDRLGYRTVGINHIGDWGSQFGKLVAALERWGDEYDLENEAIHSLAAIYVRYHETEDSDPELAERAKEAFRELESGVDGPVRAKWRMLTELSLREFDKIYERLGVTFDHIRGEAFYEPYLEPTIERIEAAGITEVSDGALIVDLSSIQKGMAPCLLRKSDGTTLYATRDLAALFHRWEEFEFDRALYVVGGEQKLHFRQLKGVLGRMQLDWETRVEHVAFGLLRLPEGKLSARKGKVLAVEDVLDEVVEQARRVVSEKNPDLTGHARVAEQVGVGALVFNDLKRERTKDVVFDMQEVLSFEGETGPYVQYTHARLASILRKSERPEHADARAAEPDLTSLEDAAAILVRLGRFPEVVRSAATHAEPSELSVWLLAACRELNSWYVDHRVLGVEPRLSAARLRLIRACKSVLGNGLELLGVAAPEEM